MVVTDCQRSSAQSTNDKNYPSDRQNLFLRDLPTDPVPQSNGCSRADQMPKQGSEGDHVGVERCGQGNGCDLRSISPFGQECHHESLCQNVGVGDDGLFAFLCGSAIIFRPQGQIFTVSFDELRFHLLEFMLHFFQLLVFLFFLVLPSLQYHFDSKVEEQDGDQDVCKQWRNPRSGNFAEDGTQDSHHKQCSIRTHKDDTTQVSSCHNHSQEECFIPHFTDQDSQKGCGEASLK